MKYIKLFESKIKKYKVGDYVLIDVEKINRQNIKDHLSEEENYPDGEKAKIINDTPVDYDYKIIFDTNRDYNISEDEIIRYLSEDEILNFETNLTAKKYNI